MKEIIITSSVLILCIMLIRVIFKGKISSRLQYALWILAALRLLIPASAQIYMALGSVEEFRIMDLANLMESKVGDVTEQLEKPVHFTMSLNSDLAEQAAEFTLGEELDLPTTADGPTAVFLAGTVGGLIWLDVFRGIWVGGMVIVALWMFITNVMFTRKLHKGRKEFVLPEFEHTGGMQDQESSKWENTKINRALRKTKIYTIEGIASPCLHGVPFREAVYLTPDIAGDQDRLRHVLIHEMCHKKHGDSFWSILRSILLVVYWMNPLVWVAAVLSKRDCELACDEEALLILGEKERIHYGETLLSIITSKGKLSDIACTATTMTGSGKSVKERIKYIADKPRVLGVTVAAVLVMVMVVLILVFTKNPLFSGTTWEGEAALTAGDMQIKLPETLAGISAYETDSDGNIIIYQTASGEEAGRFCEVYYGEAVLLVEQGREVVPIGNYGRNWYLVEYMKSLYPNTTVDHYYTPYESIVHNYSAPDNFADEGVPGTDSNNGVAKYIIEDESKGLIFTELNKSAEELKAKEAEVKRVQEELTAVEARMQEQMERMEAPELEEEEAERAEELLTQYEAEMQRLQEELSRQHEELQNYVQTIEAVESTNYPAVGTGKEETISYLPNEKIVVTYNPGNTATKCYIYVKGDYSGVKAQYLEELNYIDSILKVVAEQVIVVESD